MTNKANNPLARYGPCKKKDKIQFDIYNINLVKIKECFGWEEVFNFIGRTYRTQGTKNFLSNSSKKILINKMYYVTRESFLFKENMF